MQGKGGGVLLVAVMFTVISAVTVAGFIRLAHHELRLSNLQFYTNESLNLAEGGLDEALYALNHTWWTGWDVDGETARMAVRDIGIGRAAVGRFHVQVDERDSMAPIVTAFGETIAGSGLTTAKQVRISLRKRSYFANTITARYYIDFSGNNARVLSYRSSEGPAGQAPERDSGIVASVWVGADAVDLNNADVWGYVFTGGEEPNVGPHGTILGEDSPAGVKIDPERVARDYTSEFPVALDPPPTDVYLPPITETLVLPRPEEAHITDRPVVYSVDRVNLQGRTLSIDGNVILVAADNIDISGRGIMEVKENSSFRLYAYQRIRITGQGGMQNETRIPSNMVIFGMNTLHQDFDLGGNAAWEAGIYAPNADIALNGGGNSGRMAGGVVGKNVVLNGGSIFYGDEDLAGFTEGFGFAMDEWTDLPRQEWIDFN